MQKPLTTGQVAKILGVSTRTANKLVDSGEIRGHRLRTDRRVERDDLREFMVGRGMSANRIAEIDRLYAA